MLVWTEQWSCEAGDSVCSLRGEGVWCEGVPEGVPILWRQALSSVHCTGVSQLGQGQACMATAEPSSLQLLTEVHSSSVSDLPAQTCSPQHSTTS